MPRVLVLFAHPALEKSRINARLLREMPHRPELTFHDLYEEYPRFDIDVLREQELLSAHDLIVMHHPMFWYSVPPLLKQWIDLVLEHGWAYGSTGRALVGKSLLTLTTVGGGEQAYTSGGYNRFTIREFLTPIEQTAVLCNMVYLPPYIVHSTHRLTNDELEMNAKRYRWLLNALCDERIDWQTIRQLPTLNATVEDLMREVPA